jgi:hypothetical protein
MAGNDRTLQVSPRKLPLNMAEIAGLSPGLSSDATDFHPRPGMTFQKVSHCILLASVVATTSVAFYHLWKELCRDQRRR